MSAEIGFGRSIIDWFAAVLAAITSVIWYRQDKHADAIADHSVRLAALRERLDSLPTAEEVDEGHARVIAEIRAESVRSQEFRERNNQLLTAIQVDAAGTRADVATLKAASRRRR